MLDRSYCIEDIDKYPSTTIRTVVENFTFSYDQFDNLKIVIASNYTNEVTTFLVKKRVKTRKEIFKQFLKDFFKK